MFELQDALNSQNSLRFIEEKQEITADDMLISMLRTLVDSLVTH